MALLTVLISCNQSTSGPEVILRLGHQAKGKDVWNLSSLHFAHLVDSLSHGRMEVWVYPNEQLGGELEMIRSIEAGVVDMTVTGESMQVWTDIASFCGMPYLIRDIDHLKNVVDGAAGERIAEELRNKIGLKTLCYFGRGPRYLTSNRPIRSPDDLKGIILRVPTVPMSVAVWEALGAKPTPMTFSEVFTSLQQGTVEAQENPFALIYSEGFYEVQKYLSLTGHVIGWVYLVIGEKKFNSLSPEFQDIILQAAKSTQNFHESVFISQEAQLRKKLEDAGMEFIEVNDEAFREIAIQTIKSKLSADLGKFYQEIQETK